MADKSKDTELILCVDDDATVLRVLDVLLTREGYSVLTANSGQQGIELLKQNKVDLIVCDQKMPGMNGWEFFRHVSKDYPEIVRIMLSGYTDFEGLVRAINEGEIFRFISKPWDNETLKEIIRNALDESGWTEDLGATADGAGTSAFAYSKEDVRCEVSAGKPASLLDGEIVEDGTTYVEANCFTWD